MIEYLAKAATAWFVGFFPLAEIYIAVPSAMALGLDPLSSVLWSVLGNFTPVLLVELLYEQLTRHPRLEIWLQRLRSNRVRRHLDRWGLWFVFLVTPWTGVWVMVVTIKTLGMQRCRLLATTFASISLYAVGIAALMQLGVDVAT